MLQEALVPLALALFGEIRQLIRFFILKTEISHKKQFLHVLFHHFKFLGHSKVRFHKLLVPLVK